MEPLCLAETVRPRACQAGRGDDDDRPTVLDDRELAPVGDPGLVHMAGQDELRACGGEPLEHRAPAGERPLPRAPGRVRQLMVETDDAEDLRRRSAELPLCSDERILGKAAGLVAPRSHGVQPDHEEIVRAMHRRRGLPLLLERLPRSGEAGRRKKRDVVISGDGEHGRPQAPEHRRRAGVLLARPAVREVASRDHEIGLDAPDEIAQRILDVGCLAGPDVEVGDMDQAGGHGRGRLSADPVPQLGACEAQKGGAHCLHAAPIAAESMGAPPTTFTESDALLERAPALAVLEEAFTTVRETSGGRLVFVCGEIGAGKTALLRRFCEATGDRARVLWGACDPLFAPRPLGPLLDIARVTGGDFAHLVQAGALPHDVASALIGELSDRPPAILVLEDVHWADGATLDVLRLLGRRVDEAQTLVIATYRDTELGPFHPLRQVLGEVGAGRTSVRVRLEPLSPEAVAELAEPYGADPVALYAMTGGNPFFVTEALAAGEEEIPPTVRDAVLARAARLSAPARVLLEAVAVAPPRAELTLLEAVASDALGSLDECLASGMLVSGSEAVSFRHELARLAIEDAIPLDRTLALHRAVLAALVESPDAVDLARLAHHAEGAGDPEAVLGFAIRAGERAASLGAHTEAAAQYGRALRFADALPLEERAALLRRRSGECFLVAQDAEALMATDAAIACYRELGQPTQEADCLRSRALILLNLACLTEAIDAAEEAIELLEKLPASHELAMSYGTRAALAVLFEDATEVELWARRGLELAELLGDGEAEVSARCSLGAIEAMRGSPSGIAELERTLEVAAERGLLFQVARIYVYLGVAACRARSLRQMEDAVELGRPFCEEHGVLSLGRYLIAMQSWLELERGAWDDATETALLTLSEQCLMSCTQARIVLGLLRARRGDPDPWTPLAEAEAVAAKTGQLWWLWQVAAAKAEAAWLEGTPELIGDATERAFELATRHGSPWPIAELGWWRKRAGIEESVPDVAAGPHLHQLRGEWSEAAAAWEAAGCPYERAVALGETGDEEAQREALDELTRLGARPAAQTVARKLRERGARVPRGPGRRRRRTPPG